MAPGDYQRQLRLRAARRLIAQGRPIGAAAAQAGFSDQSHLTRWFIRCYGITPGGYQRATLASPRPEPEGVAVGVAEPRAAGGGLAERCDVRPWQPGRP